MARTNGVSLSSAERGGITENAWDDMESLLVARPLAIFRERH
jgi:hypothetical protein